MSYGCKLEVLVDVLRVRVCVLSFIINLRVSYILILVVLRLQASLSLDFRFPQIQVKTRFHPRQDFASVTKLNSKRFLSRAIALSSFHLDIVDNTRSLSQSASSEYTYELAAPSTLM